MADAVGNEIVAIRRVSKALELLGTTRDKLRVLSFVMGRFAEDVPPPVTASASGVEADEPDDVLV